jgi:hypothetical protein
MGTMVARSMLNAVITMVSATYTPTYNGPAITSDGGLPHACPRQYMTTNPKIESVAHVIMTMLLARMFPFCSCILTELSVTSGRVSRYITIANAAAARHAATTERATALLASHPSLSAALLSDSPVLTLTEAYFGVFFSTTPDPVKTKALSSGITVFSASILTSVYCACHIDAHSRPTISEACSHTDVAKGR